MAKPSCPLCNQPIRTLSTASTVQAYAKHFNGECTGRPGRAKRPQ